MNKIKMTACLYAALLLLTAIPAFSDGPNIDFDGKHKNAQNMKNFITKNAQVSLPVPAKAESGLIVKRELLNEAGDWVEFKPIKTWFDGGVKYNQYTIKPGLATRWTLRCNKGKWTARETYNFWNDQYGGHYHYDPSPPALAISSVTLSTSTLPSTAYHQTPSPINLPEMQGNTTYYYWKKFPGFATKVAEQFVSSGACQGNTQTDYMDVKIPGLLEMTEGKNYVLYNSEEAMAYHPDNHYGTQKLIDTLKTIADGYRAVFPNDAPIQINDMSLPWGGIFDVENNWERFSSSVYYMHETGLSADMEKTTVPLESRQKLLEIMCRNAPIVYSEQIPGKATNFHIAVSSGTAGVLTRELVEVSGITAVWCCTGTNINPAHLQICVSTEPYNGLTP